MSRTTRIEWLREAVGAKPGTLQAAVNRLPAEAVFNGLIKLNWAAQGWEATGWKNLKTALAADLRKTLPLAVRAAVASGDPIGRIAADVFDPAAHHDLAADLDEMIPHQTTALRELAAVFRTYPDAYDGWMTTIFRHYLDRCERLGVDPDVELLQPIADILESRYGSASGGDADA